MISFFSAEILDSVVTEEDNMEVVGFFRVVVEVVLIVL